MLPLAIRLWQDKIVPCLLMILSHGCHLPKKILSVISILASNYLSSNLWLCRSYSSPYLSMWSTTFTKQLLNDLIIHVEAINYRKRDCSCELERLLSSVGGFHPCWDCHREMRHLYHGPALPCSSQTWGGTVDYFELLCLWLSH